MPLTFPIPTDTLVLTANSRLARYLILQDSLARNPAETAWPSPPVYALESWLQEQWVQSWPERYPISPWQRQMLWESLLENDAELKRLDPLSFETLAREASQAYRLFHEYRLPADSKAYDNTDESRTFLKWKLAADAALQDRHLIDPSGLLNQIEIRMRNGEIKIPEKLILAGFDELYPALEHWLERLKQSGTSVSFYPRPPETPTSYHLENQENLEFRPLENLQQEVIQCTRWIRSVYQPGNRIGIIALRMQEYRETIRRELIAELAPGSVFCWKNDELPFNLSLGAPLSAEPVIQAALNVLTAPAPPLSLALFNKVIKNPYLNGGACGEDLDALLELTLNKKKMLSVDLESAFRLVQSPKGVKKRESKQFRPLRKLIEEWSRFLTDKRNRKARLPSEWAREFTLLLGKLGWPHQHHELQTRERQAYIEWEKRLDDFASLDTILNRISRLEAAHHIQRIASNPDQPFQETTREDTPIQVMGALEAAGQEFDHLWVMGCHAEALPEVPRPNPFIPISLQKEHHLPHATAARELDYSRRILARLARSAPRVIFSAPLWRGEESLTVSPLLKNLADNTSLMDTSHRLKDMTPSSQTVEIEDVPPPVIEEAELAKVHGGFRILKNQADCPFRAFAVHRLMADRVDPPELDYENMDRGNLVHNTLEFFWAQVKDRKHLEELHQTGKLESTIRACVQKAMNEEDFQLKWRNQPSFASIEEDRTTQLIAEFMQLELARNDFSVLAQEKKEIFYFAGLKLQFRIDRIDQVNGDQKLLIDYKTGKIQTSGWFRPPLRDPQLPLYACHLKPDGIAFAQVKKGDIKYDAAFKPGQDLTGINLKKFEKDTGCSTWDDLLEYWNNQLLQQAQNFKNSRVEIRPLDGDTTCRFCNLGSFCRIGELAQSELPEQQS